MSVGVIVNIRVKPGGVETWAAALRHSLPHTRTWPGCEDIYVGINQENPYHLMIVERWATREQYESYRQWSTAQGAEPEMMAMLDGPLETTYLDDIGA